MDVDCLKIFSLHDSQSEKILFELLSDRIFYFEAFSLCLGSNFNACDHFWKAREQFSTNNLAFIYPAISGVRICQFFFTPFKKNRNISSHSRFFNPREESGSKDVELISNLLSPFLVVKIPDYINVNIGIKEIILQVITIFLICKENFSE